MRLVPLLLLLVLVGCGGARTSLVESGCMIGSSHADQTCGGAPVYGDSHDRDRDGVSNDDDLCPDTRGRGTTNGCPPHDAD